MATDWTFETIEDRINAEEARYPNIPRGLSKAVAWQESKYNPDARGDNQQAQSFFQLHPGAAKDAGIDPARRGDPELNIKGGVKYLSLVIDRAKGDIPTALSLYNRGTPDYRGIGDPNYVQNVARHYKPPEGEKPSWLVRLGRAVSPASAEAAEPPKRAAARNWWDEPVVATGTAPPAAPAGNWWDTPVVAPQEPPAAATGPQAPAAPPTAPATSQGPPAASGEPPSDLVIDITGPPEDEPPAAPPAPATPGGRPTMSEQIAAHERGELPNDDRSWYQRIYDEWVAPGFKTQPPQPGTHEERKAQALASVDRLQAQQPGGMFGEYDSSRPRNVAREVAATGIETGAGVLGTVAGARRGGPAGAVAGGVAGQSYGRRITNQLGLRQEEAPFATIAPGVKLYPSDIANAAFGAIPALPQLAKQALRGTMAGKAILAADDALRTAHSAWKQQSDKALQAQKTGTKQAYEDALTLTQEKQADFVKKQAAREQVIQANQAEYNAATQQHITESRATAVKNVQQRAEWRQQVQARREQAYTSRRERLEGVQADRAQREQARADTIQANQQADLQRNRAELRQDIQQDLDAGRETATVQERRYGRARQNVQQQQRDALAKEAQAEWAEEGQEWSIHKARDITERYLPKEPSWKLYDRLDKQATTPDPVTGKPVDVAVPAPKSALQEMQSNWTKGIDGAPAPLPPAVQQEVDAILQGADEATFMGIRNTMKRLGPLTRSKDSEVRRASKQVFGVLGEALEQHPQASNTLKYANKNWQKETLLGDMREWLEPGGGLVSYDDAGREVIRIGGDSGLLTRVEKQMRTNPMWKRAFTERQMQNLRDEVWQIAGETKMPPATVAQARPELLPGATATVPNTGDLAIPARPPQRGLSAPTPEPAPLPPVRPSRVPTLLPGAIPDVPQSMQKPPAGAAYKDPPVLKKPPAEPQGPRLLPGGSGLKTRPKGVDIEPAPTRQVPTKIEKGPEFWGEVKGVGTWGAFAYTLQRMGLAPGIIDNALAVTLVGTGTRIVGQRANYMLSQALLNPKYRSLNKHFLTMMDNGQAVVDPKLYNVMLAIMTPEEKRAMERETREPQKARR